MLRMLQSLSWYSFQVLWLLPVPLSASHLEDTRMFQPDFVNEFQVLSKLIKDADATENVDTSNVSKPSPANIGPRELLNVKVPAAKGRKDPKAIWDESEVLEAIVEDDIDDGRLIPEYEFVYKQAVETTDVFLGMSGKDESSTSCEQMVVKISLPEINNISELDLDVKATYIKLNSTKYKLSMYLPHKVNDDKGKAKWDKDKKILSVTLPIIREDPF